MEAYKDWYKYFTHLNRIRLDLFEEKLSNHMKEKNIDITEES